MKKTWRIAAAAGLAVGIVALSAPSAGSDVRVEKDAVSLTKSGDEYTASVRMVNRDSIEVPINATAKRTATDAKPCEVDTRPRRLDEDSDVLVAVTVPATCVVDGKAPTVRFEFENATPVIVERKSSLPTKSAPDWGALVLFWGGLAISVGIALVALAFTYGNRDKDERPPKGSFWEPAKGLDDAWSFKDSWVTNISFGAAIFTAIFAATDILKNSLGKDPTDQLAVMLVAAAIAAGLASAGVLITKAFAEQGKPFTWAVVLAAVPTFTGAVGQVLVVADQADQLDLGALNFWIWPIAWAAIGLLVVFGVFAMRQFLLEETVEAKQELSQTLIAAALTAMGEHLIDEPAEHALAAREAARFAQNPDAARSVLRNVKRKQARDAAAAAGQQPADDDAKDEPIPGGTTDAFVVEPTRRAHRSAAF